jgi:hypothetical protein
MSLRAHTLIHRARPICHGKDEADVRRVLGRVFKSYVLQERAVDAVHIARVCAGVVRAHAPRLPVQMMVDVLFTLTSTTCKWRHTHIGRSRVSYGVS